MTSKELDTIKNNFIGKLHSLERDSYRAFTLHIRIDHNLGAGAAPFPITLYCMSVLDFFSGAFAGYSEKKHIRDRDDQTARMINFLTKYLHYDKNVSGEAIDIFRHKLVHLSEPVSNKFGWEIAYAQAEGDHWTIQTANLAGDKFVRFGVEDFIRDLKNGILGPTGYFKDLKESVELQDRYNNFLKEIRE